jgi:ribosomal-protein-alanine N-acetyltransferase
MATMPTEFLTTERLILRPFAAQDAAAFYRLNGDPEVMRWLPKDEVFATEAEALQFVQHYLAASANWPFARWAVTEKKTGDFLGWSGLRELPDGEVDLGYRLLREHWGLGYATESGRAWVRYGFEQAGLVFLPFAGQKVEPKALGCIIGLTGMKTFDSLQSRNSQPN